MATGTSKISDETEEFLLKHFKTKTAGSQYILNNIVPLFNDYMEYDFPGDFSQEDFKLIIEDVSIRNSLSRSPINQDKTIEKGLRVKLIESSSYSLYFLFILVERLVKIKNKKVVEEAIKHLHF